MARRAEADYGLTVSDESAPGRRSFERGLGDVERKMTVFHRALESRWVKTGARIGAGLGGWVTTLDAIGNKLRPVVGVFGDVSSEIDEIAKRGRQTGLGAELTSALRSMTESAGTDYQTTLSAVEQMGIRSEKAVKGVRLLRETMVDLGMDTDRWMKRDPTAQIEAIDRALERRGVGESRRREIGRRLSAAQQGAGTAQALRDFGLDPAAFGALGAVEQLATLAEATARSGFGAQRRNELLAEIGGEEGAKAFARLFEGGARGLLEGFERAAERGLVIDEKRADAAEAAANASTDLADSWKGLIESTVGSQKALESYTESLKMADAAMLGVSHLVRGTGGAREHFGEFYSGAARHVARTVLPVDAATTILRMIARNTAQPSGTVLE